MAKKVCDALNIVLQQPIIIVYISLYRLKSEVEWVEFFVSENPPSFQKVSFYEVPIYEKKN
jgi:hypothetical protein